MEASALGRTPPRSGPVQLGLIASLLVVATGAWAVTGDRMSGMDAGPGTELGGLGWFTVVWVTMMAAMMLPSIPRSSWHPGNVWSLHGYHECLVRLGKPEPARIVKQQLDVALARADVPIKSSCFCRMTHAAAVA